MDKRSGAKKAAADVMASFSGIAAAGTLPEQTPVSGNTANSIVGPNFLSTFYNIANPKGNQFVSQSFYSDLNQSYSSADLTTFQQGYGLTVQQPQNIGGHVYQPACPSFSNCGEANLDSQYLMGISQGTPTISFYSTNSTIFLSWIISVANMKNPPLVNSISYGGYEASFTPSQLRLWNTEAIKLGLQGVSIMVSSGDSGVEGYVNQLAYCGYGAQFPASSPYVTTVGATQGYPTIVVAQSNKGGSITSGGGFSQFYPQPSWQKASVKGYFNLQKPYQSTVINAAAPYIVNNFNASKRGYPDVSAWSSFVYVVIGGTPTPVAGTSVSSPVFAAMISLLNARLQERGLPPMGFLNPFLYKYGNQFLVDVTSGTNNCFEQGTSSSYCCTAGFSATIGWDPATGLGYPNFSSMLNVALATVTRAPTAAPNTITMTFTSSFVVTNIATPTLDTASQQAISTTAANAMNLDANQVSISSVTYMNRRLRDHRAQNALLQTDNTHGYTATVVTLTSVAVDPSKTAQMVFDELSALLMALVDSGAFTTNLHVVAQAIPGAGGLNGATMASVSSALVGTPASQSTATPSVVPAASLPRTLTGGQVAGIVIGSFFGLLCLVPFVFAVLRLGTSRKALASSDAEAQSSSNVASVELKDVSTLGTVGIANAVTVK